MSIGKQSQTFRRTVLCLHLQGQAVQEKLFLLKVKYRIFRSVGNHWKCVTSGFCREVHEICALLGYYSSYSGNSLPTFRDNIWVPSSRIKKPNSSWISWSLGRGLVSCAAKAVRNYQYMLRNIPEERKPLILKNPYDLTSPQHLSSGYT
jgi:hypothetical protein